MKHSGTIVFFLAVVVLCLSCVFANEKTTQQMPNNYWFQGKAEISSYQLKQVRYGEIHEGEAVLIFVTEPFSEKSFTKADVKTSEDVGVLKLNFTKKFNTGIYPYSMMTSTFFPFKNGKHSLKISSSSQEWCGHTYMDLQPTPTKFNININSYFEGESTSIVLDKSLLEDDLWTMIKLNPKSLPQGNNIQMIPSFFFLRLKHQACKVYTCEAELAEKNGNYSYSINYPTLKRNLTISFEKQAPYKILGWTETYISGWGANAITLTTSATLKRSMMVDYWNKNSNQYKSLRKELDLKE
jgi:hypothetical protein